MSYVVEFAESVHSTFRAPNNFCHDLQHVMRGAVKNLSQTCQLTSEPQQLARYQVIYTALQNIIDTNTTMSECTVTESDTFTMMESAADYLAGSEHGSGQRRNGLSASSFKSPESAREQTFESFDKVAAENLSNVLTPDMVAQLSDVYNTAIVIQKLEAQLKVVEPKVKKYTKQKKEEKLAEAQREEASLNTDLTNARTALNNYLNKCFPEMYKHILRQYIDLCSSLLRATEVGTAIFDQATLDWVGQPADNPLAHRERSVALTVDALEAHEALEEVKQEMQHHQHDDPKNATATATAGTPKERKLHERIQSLLSPPHPPSSPEHVAPATASETPHTAPPPSSLPPSISTTTTHAPPAPAAAAAADAPQKSATASTEIPPLESAKSSSDKHSSGNNDSVRTNELSGISVTAATPSNATAAATAEAAPVAAAPPSTTATPDHKEKDSPSSHSSSTRRGNSNEETAVGAASHAAATEHASESVAPSVAATVHSHFPFWFRYYYFDRLANSTERLAIAFALYTDYCKRLARKAGYTIPIPIKKHMERMHMEFSTARYARHKREFQAVLKEIFNYRKNLEIMETHVRLARDAEAHVLKHTKSKNKKGLEKWNAKLQATNNHIEQLRVEVFGKGAEDMINFYDQLLQCIRGSMSDLIITMGGTPP